MWYFNKGFGTFRALNFEEIFFVLLVHNLDFLMNFSQTLEILEVRPFSIPSSLPNIYRNWIEKSWNSSSKVTNVIGLIVWM